MTRVKEGNVLFNNALNTFYLRLYGISQTYGKGPEWFRRPGYTYMNITQLKNGKVYREYFVFNILICNYRSSV